MEKEQDCCSICYNDCERLISPCCTFKICIACINKILKPKESGLKYRRYICPMCKRDVITDVDNMFPMTQDIMNDICGIVSNKTSKDMDESEEVEEIVEIVNMMNTCGGSSMNGGVADIPIINLYSNMSSNRLTSLEGCPEYIIRL